MEGLKRCPKCSEFKERSEFNKNKTNKSGLQTHCKKCQSRKSTKIPPIMPIDGEVWLPVVGYEGFYSVSNLGRVRSDSRIKSGSLGTFVSQEFIVSARLDKGYVRLVLQKNGSIKSYNVHRLVAIAFISNPDNLPQVNHKDLNKSNNNLSNLEWVTRGENIRHGIRDKKTGSKYLGVYKDKRYKSWQVVLNGKYIGSFQTEEDAVFAAKKELQESGIENRYADY